MEPSWEAEITILYWSLKETAFILWIRVYRKVTCESVQIFSSQNIKIVYVFINSTRDYFWVVFPADLLKIENKPWLIILHLEIENVSIVFVCKSLNQFFCIWIENLFKYTFMLLSWLQVIKKFPSSNYFYGYNERSR